MYDKLRAKQASAFSFEDFRRGATSSGVATESLGKEDYLKKAYALSFVEDTVVDLLMDGHIFFSSNPEEAYDQLLMMLQDGSVRHYVLKGLTSCGDLTNKVAFCQALRSRLHRMERETDARWHELNNKREQLVAEDPTIEEQLY